MNSIRLAIAIVAGCCLLRPAPLPAADATPPATAPAAPVLPPYTMEKHYSADMTVTLKGGTVIGSKSFIDDDKMRSDLQMHGMAMSIIVRKDTKKIYQVLTEQKMVMVSDFNPETMVGNAASSFGSDGKFTLIGPETLDGTACTKYSVTSDKTKQVFYFWLDNARKVPVQMAATDGSLVVKWSNFIAGPQDPALFEPPAGYQVVEAPAGMPGAPGGQ